MNKLKLVKSLEDPFVLETDRNGYGVLQVNIVNYERPSFLFFTFSIGSFSLEINIFIKLLITHDS